MLLLCQPEFKKHQLSQVNRYEISQYSNSLAIKQETTEAFSAKTIPAI